VSPAGRLLVHRYCGREHGGHRGVAASPGVAPEALRIVERRSDLAGEDLGRAVPPYYAGYPLPGGDYALAWTIYLTDADCLGAVRTETLVLDRAAQDALGDPLGFDPAAFGRDADLAGELDRYRRTHTPSEVAPRPVPARPAPRIERLAPLAAVAEPLRTTLLAGLLGPLPLTVVGGEPPLLRALLALYPGRAAWEVGLCTQALSHREWAQLEGVPPAAADRLAIRAARQKDVAVVDLAAGAARNVDPAAAPLAATLAAWVAAGAWGEVVDLVERAGAVAAYRAPGDLAALRRYEALRDRDHRSPQETIELANHLKARGAPAHEVADRFRELLETPPAEASLQWLVNVVRTGWLAYRRAHAEVVDDAAGAVADLLERTLSEGRPDLAAAFVEDMGELYPDVRRRVEEGALGLARSEAPLEGSAVRGRLVELLRGLLARSPERAPELAAAFAARAPLAPAPVLEELLDRFEGAPGEPSWRGALAVADAAAASELPPTFARAVGLVLEGAAPEGLAREAVERVAAYVAAPRDLLDRLTDVALARPGPFEQLLRALRPRSEALMHVARRLRDRVDDLPAFRGGGGRLLARAAVNLGRAAPAAGLRGLARDRWAELVLREEGPGPLLARAARKAALRAYGPATAALEAARGGAGSDAGALETGPGAVPPDAGALDQPTPVHAELAAGGHTTGAAESAGDHDTGLGDDLEGHRTGALKPGQTAALEAAAEGFDPDGLHDTGVALAVPAADPAGHAAVLRAVLAAPPAAGEAAAARRLLAAVPGAAWSELGLSELRRLGDLAPDAAAHGERLEAAARGTVRAELAGAEPPGPAFDDALDVLGPAAGAEPEVLAACAEGVRRGRLDLRRLARSSPELLDAVLGRAADGFSLRLQHDLRELLFDLAANDDGGDRRRAALAAGLRRLAALAAPDRAFRREVAAGVRRRLDDAAAGGGAALEPGVRALEE